MTTGYFAEKNGEERDSWSPSTRTTEDRLDLDVLVFQPWRSTSLSFCGRNRTDIGITLDLGLDYPVVIINWVQYLGPPGPFSFPDSRDLLEVLGGLSRQRETPGRIP